MVHASRIQQEQRQRHGKTRYEHEIYTMTGLRSPVNGEI